MSTLGPAVYKVRGVSMEKLREELQEEQRQEREKMAEPEQDIPAQLPVLSPIRGVPVEILSIIFTYFVQDKPSYIRRLLLVCRQWHNIIMNTPSLWSRIQIIVQKSLGGNELFSLSTYVRSCIDRSREMLLDIVIDYGECKGVDDHYIDLLLDRFRGLIENKSADAPLDIGEADSEGISGSKDSEVESGSEDSEDENGSDDSEESFNIENLSDSNSEGSLRADCFEESINSLEWDYYPAQSRLEAYYLLPLRNLVGQRGEVMKRWRSINITFPSSLDFDDLASNAMGLFHFPAPFLESVSLKWLYKRRLQLAQSAEGTFLSTPSLKTLRLFTNTIQVVSPSINHSQLVDLFVHVSTMEHLHLLSRSTCLKRLGLIISGHSSLQFHVTTGFNLKFPHLQELTCGKLIPWTLQGLLHAPNLEFLHLMDDDAFNSMEGCTFTSSVKRLILPPDTFTVYSDTIDDHIFQIISTFVSLREVCVHQYDKKIVQRYFSRLRGSGHLPLLQTLVLGDSFEDFEEKIDYYIQYQ